MIPSSDPVQALADQIRSLSERIRMIEQRSPLAGIDIPAMVPPPAWADWTPAWTAVTLGNGSTWGRVLVDGQTVDFVAKLTLGSTSVVGSGVSLTLPYAGAADRMSALGVTALDAGSSNYALGAVSYAGAVQPYALGAGGAAAGVVGPNVPFTWAVGDELVIRGRYERS